MPLFSNLLAVACCVCYFFFCCRCGKFFTRKWTQAVRFEYVCGGDLSKGEKCTCPPKVSYFATMALQFIATAIVGLIYFVLTPISIWLSILVIVAFCAWMKATLKFQIPEFKRWITLCAINVRYFFVVSVIMVVFALL